MTISIIIILVNLEGLVFHRMNVTVFPDEVGQILYHSSFGENNPEYNGIIATNPRIKYILTIEAICKK